MLRIHKKPKSLKSLPEIDECRYILLRLVEQSVRDYLSLEGAAAPVERWYFATAECFLFEDEYRIDWGGVDKSLSDILDILDIDIDWFRDKVKKLKRKKVKETEIARLLDD